MHFPRKNYRMTEERRLLTWPPDKEVINQEMSRISITLSKLLTNYELLYQGAPVSFMNLIKE